LAVTRKLPKGVEKGESDGFLAVDKIASLIKGAQENKYGYAVGQIKENLQSVVNTINLLYTVNFSNVVNENGSGTFLHGMPALSSLFIQLGGNYSVVDSYGEMYKNAFGKNIPKNTSEYAPLIKQNIVKFLDSANGIYAANEYISSIGTSVTGDDFNKLIGYNGDIEARKIDAKNKAGEIANKISAEIAGKHREALSECRSVESKLQKYKEGTFSVKADVESLIKSPVNTNDSESSYLYAQTVLNRLGALEKETWWTIRILSGFGIYKDSINIGMISQIANGLK
jgi:hypothetical protein